MKLLNELRKISKNSNTTEPEHTIQKIVHELKEAAKKRVKIVHYFVDDDQLRQVVSCYFSTDGMKVTNTTHGVYTRTTIEWE